MIVLLALSETADTAERIALTDRDADRVSDLLENPPKPTPALQAAATAPGRAALSPVRVRVQEPCPADPSEHPT